LDAPVEGGLSRKRCLATHAERDEVPEFSGLGTENFPENGWILLANSLQSDKPIYCNSLHDPSASCLEVLPYPCSPAPFCPSPTRPRASPTPPSPKATLVSDSVMTSVPSSAMTTSPTSIPAAASRRYPLGGWRWSPSCSSARTSPTAGPPTPSAPASTGSRGFLHIPPKRYIPASTRSWPTVRRASR
jgi:hypothetical protein